MGLGAGSRAGCLWAARRSAPLTPCRGKYAQMWLKVRHLSAFSHGGQNVTSELAAGVDFQVRQRVDSNGRQAPVCRKAPTNSPEDPEMMTRQYKRMCAAGDLAVSQAEELKQALDDLISNKFTVGDHHFTLHVLA